MSRKKLAGIIAVCIVAVIAVMVYIYRPPSYDPEIRDWHDLQAIGYHLDKSFILMNDLDATTAGYEELASETANEGKGWQPIGTFDEGFTGSFNGQGYEVRDMFIDRPEESVVGLFGAIDGGGVIQNVGVVNAFVSGHWAVGCLVGLNDGIVKNSYSTGTVTGDLDVGGLVGHNHGTVNNSHYDYNTFLINGESIITTGALFGTDFEEWLANGKLLDVNERLSQEGGYYVVNNITDFKELLAFGQDGSLKFKLKDDLDLGNDPGFYIPYLAGVFHGNGHKILNLSFDFNFISKVGLFGHVSAGGRVIQLGVERVTITGRSYLGGLVGDNEGTVNNSYSTGSVTGDADVGGLVGLNGGYGNMTNSYSTCNVTGVTSVGGLVGGNAYYATITNSYSDGIVIGGRVVGGLVGASAGTVNNSYSTCSVTGDANVGGLVGMSFRDTLSNSYSNGNVTRSSGEDTNFGGFVGHNYQGKIINCYSTGSVHYEDADDPTDKGFAGSTDTGGDYEMSGNFWDAETSGQTSTSGEAAYKTTAELHDISTFTDWDICGVLVSETNQAYIWNIIDSETYPFLSWQSISSHNLSFS